MRLNSISNLSSIGFLTLALPCLAGGISAPAPAPAAPAPAAQQTAVKEADAADQVRTLDSHFPFVPPDNVQPWEARRAELKQHLAISLGLWPAPKRTPLNAVEHSRREMEDYFVSCVSFESLPGFFVTGNLYRPKSAGASSGQAPVVLCPYGHFNNGRFLDHDPNTVDAMIARHEESEPSNARSPLQAHCVHLARMGCVVFHYDMVGYADSRQIPYEVAHFLRARRDQDNHRDGWLFFSPRAELHNQSIMGLQTWNSMRALDYVQGLEGVDPQRIGVTGCSGGGTQTFILAALDERVQAAFAAAMVSTGMQGGCTCENACNLRTVTGNVELAALFAPKPMGLSAANDWTKSMPEDGFPQLQRLYQLLGQPENCFLAPSLNLPHGYNEIARRSMYAWFNRHLKIVDDPEGLTVQQVYRGPLPPTSIYRERPFQVLTSQEMTVWNEAHPAPPRGLEVEQKLTQYWAKSQAASITKMRADDPAQLKPVVRSLISDLDRNDQDQLRIEPLPTEGFMLEDQSIKLSSQRIFNETDYRTGLVIRHLAPEQAATALIVVLGELENSESIAQKFVKAAATRRYSIVAIDSAELLKPNPPLTGRPSASYAFGYNRTQLGKDARSLAWAIDHLCEQEQPAELWIVALDQSTALAAVAAAACRTRVPCTKFVGTQAEFDSVEAFDDPNFLPGALLLGDLEGILAIVTQSPPSRWPANQSPSIEELMDVVFATRK